MPKRKRTEAEGEEEELATTQSNAVNSRRQSVGSIRTIRQSSTDANNLEGPTSFAYLHLHGTGDIISSTSLGCRLFWISAVIVATGLAIWMCAMIVNKYASNPTVTRLEFKAPKLRYPYLTICSSSKHSAKYFLDEQKLRADSVSDAAVKLVLLSGPVWFLGDNEIPGKSVLNNSNATHFRKKLQQEFGPSQAAQFHGFFKKYGVSCQDLFHSCRNANWHKMNCCEIFQPVYNFQHGLCFANDPNRMPLISAPGLFSNFYLKFRRKRLWKPTKPDFYSSVQETVSLDIVLDAAIDQGIWRADSISLPYGRWGLVRIAAKNITKGGWSNSCQQWERLCFFHKFSFSNCMWERMLLLSDNFSTPDHCIFPMVHLSHLGFNLKALQKQNSDPQNSGANSSAHFEAQVLPDMNLLDENCSQRLTRRYCEAHEIRSVLYNRSDEPPPQRDAKTFYGVTYWMNKFNISERNPCPEPCNHIEYTYTVAYDEEPELGTEHSGITITFPDSEYADITEMRALEWFDFMALIGGVWGLWIGASIVTGIQLVVYTIRLFYDAQWHEAKWRGRFHAWKKQLKNAETNNNNAHEITSSKPGLPAVKVKFSDDGEIVSSRSSGARNGYLPVSSDKANGHTVTSA